MTNLWKTLILCACFALQLGTPASSLAGGGDTSKVDDSHGPALPDQGMSVINCEHDAVLSVELSVQPLNKEDLKWGGRVFVGYASEVHTKIDLEWREGRPSRSTRLMVGRCGDVMGGLPNAWDIIGTSFSPSLVTLTFFQNGNPVGHKKVRADWNQNARGSIFFYESKPRN